MSLQDILAKKRAAAATPAPSPAPALTAPPPAPIPEPPAPAVEAPAVVEAKPLTFAEKIALKRKQDAEASANKVPAAPVAEVNPLAILEETAVVVKKEAKEVPIVTDNMEVQQVYANLLEKINNLEHLMGDDLKNAMTNLKKGLMENPDACELMLDEDIGEMVKALRRITMQAVIETKETGGGKKKPKASTMAALTPEQLAQGLADL